MKNLPSFLPHGVLVCLSLASMAGIPTTSQADDNASSQPSRPNIVWIISEDNSKHYLKHFDSDGAQTPAIESLAQEGITFDRAFSCSPVCSVARTTLITGCYAPRIGTQYHRRHQMAAMPLDLKMFPAYLRRAGYYTTNQSKEDYNAIASDDVWDESSKKASWLNRPTDETPFFHVQTIPVSHESRMHCEVSELGNMGDTSPDSVKLPPYYPDTPVFRSTRARYHDLMGKVDLEVGKIIKRLTDDGQLENTIVFYFGDHGGVLPGSKGYTHETGLHVPLVVRVGKNQHSLVDREPGSRTQGFVEFVDFGPTVLELAGVEVPSTVDGQPFLGRDVDASDVDQREEAFGHADRFDEKYDLVRTLRVGDWKYVRNFEPHYPHSMQNNYRYKMAAYQQWRDMFGAGELSPVQAAFFLPKPPEALYNLRLDPHETENLAKDPSHRSRLKDLRNRLMDRLKDMPDLGFIPEAFAVDDVMKNPTGYGEQNSAAITELIRVANIALLPWGEAELELRSALQSKDALVRYWAIIAAMNFGEQAASITNSLERCLVDVEPIVVGKAVEFFASHSLPNLKRGADPRPFLYRSFQRTTNEPETLLLLNSVVYLRDHCDNRFPVDLNKITISKDYDPRGEVSRRMLYLRGSK